MKVLIVDHSTMFRAKIRKALNGYGAAEVVGSLSKGTLALQLISQRPVDLLLMGLSTAFEADLETLEGIRSILPSLQVVLFLDDASTSAKIKARIRRLGACKIHIRPSEQSQDEAESLEQIRQCLQSVDAPPPAAAAEAAVPIPKLNIDRHKDYRKVDLNSFAPMICVIASSTGGPAALEVVVSKLRGRVPRIPVLLVQHMPESFTRNLASRLADLSGVEVREATNGEPVKPGALILAPGNFHMRLNRNADSNYITLDQGPKVNSVRPAADLLFISAAQLYGPTCAGMILTGMGEDGCAGAKAIKAAGGGIMIQDRGSSIVWGMPAAVEKAGAYDLIGDLNACADQLATFCYGHDTLLLKKSS